MFTIPNIKFTHIALENIDNESKMNYVFFYIKLRTYYPNISVIISNFGCFRLFPMISDKITYRNEEKHIFHKLVFCVSQEKQEECKLYILDKNNNKNQRQHQWANKKIDIFMLDICIATFLSNENITNSKRFFTILKIIYCPRQKQLTLSVVGKSKNCQK